MDRSKKPLLLMRWAVPLLAMGLLLFTARCTQQPSAQARSKPPVTVTQTDHGYLFAEGRDSVLLYHRRPARPEQEHARSHFIHPLFGPTGEVLTENMPPDHLHQHGLFWAWHQMFVGSERVGDGWVQEDIRWDVREVNLADDTSGAAVLRARVFWTSPRHTGPDGQPMPFIEETTTLRVYPSAGDYREIDVAIELQALADSVRIGGSEDDKGYGGFSARVRLPEDVQFTGPGGPVKPERTAVDAGPWVDVSATFAEQGGPTGVALLQHPSSPGYPQPWILRREGSMQNAKWPGRVPAQIPQREPLVLRYRLVVHRGRAQAVPLEQLHERYAASRQ